MIHNPYTISIDRLSLMLETRDPRLVLRFGWLPVWAVKGYFLRFLDSFHRMFSEAEYNRLGSAELIKTTLYNRLLMVKAFYDLAVIGKLTPVLIEWYRYEFRRDKVDIQAVAKKIEFYQSKLKDYTRQEDQPKRKEVPFDMVVISVEAILGVTIDRSMKLYTFKHYYDKALERSRKQEG